MLEKFKKAIKKEDFAKIKALKHLIITAHGIQAWVKKEKKSFEEAYKKSFEILDEIIKLQIEQNIPILTIYLMPESLRKREEFPIFLNALIGFFERLISAEEIHEKKIELLKYNNSRGD